jgi:hypothetical protein
VIRILYYFQVKVSFTYDEQCAERLFNDYLKVADNAQFEKIDDALKSNSTQVSSDADSYQNNTDMKLSNDSDAASSTDFILNT